MLSEGLLLIFNSFAYASAVEAIKRLQRYMHRVLGKACMKENSVYKFGKRFQKSAFFLYILPIFRLMKHVIKRKADRDFNPKMRGFRYTINV